MHDIPAGLAQTVLDRLASPRSQTELRRWGVFNEKAGSGRKPRPATPTRDIAKIALAMALHEQDIPLAESAAMLAALPDIELAILIGAVRNPGAPLAGHRHLAGVKSPVFSIELTQSGFLVCRLDDAAFHEPPEHPNLILPSLTVEGWQEVRQPEIRPVLRTIFARIDGEGMAVLHTLTTWPKRDRISLLYDRPITAAEIELTRDPAAMRARATYGLTPRACELYATAMQGLTDAT